MLKTLFLLVLSVLVILSISGQAFYYESGQSGIGVGGGYSSVSGSEIYSVGLEYTSNGKLGVGAAVGFESNDDVDLTSTGYRLFANYLLIKQGESEYPVSVGILGSYQYNTFKDLDDLTSNSFSLGGVIGHEIEMEGNMSIIPFAGINYSNTNLKFDGASIEEDSGLGIQLGGALQINNFYLSPRLNFSEGDSFLAIALGVIFPQG